MPLSSTNSKKNETLPQIMPTTINSQVKVDHQHRKRKDGLEWPWHPFQITSWALYLYFGITAFGFILPVLPCSGQSASYGILGILFSLHFIFHALTISTDSSSVDLKLPVNVEEAKETKPKKIHCHIIPVTFYKEKTQFCNICKKDVFHFDHHSRIFNTCLGGANIWFYINSIVTAFLGTTCLAIMALIVFSMYCHEPWVKLDLPNSWLIYPEILAIGILIISLIDGILCLLIAPVLGYYLCLHLYLLFHGSTTHEYYKKLTRKLDLEANYPCQNLHHVSTMTEPSIIQVNTCHTAIQTEETEIKVATVITQTEEEIRFLRTIGSQTITEEGARQSSPSLIRFAGILQAPFKLARKSSHV